MKKLFALTLGLVAAAYPKEINIKISVDANGVVTVQD